MKEVDDGDSQPDEEGPEKEGDQNAPEEDLVLVLVLHPEVLEDHEEDEEVVHAERLLQDVPGDEEHGWAFALEEVDPYGEEEGGGDPDDTLENGFAEFDGMGLLVEDPEVKCQHSYDGDPEDDPKHG